jgi:organic hydroperoxide reductase OsmC/OhrA
MGMQAFPHRYVAGASAGETDLVLLTSPGLPALGSAAPVEFGGPGDRWSPETLLVAAAADCYVLTFRAVARLSGLRWIDVTCEVTGTLDRVDRVTQFTALAVHAHLRLPDGADEAQAARLLARAKEGCLVTNSLKGTVHFSSEVEVAPSVRKAS